MNQKNFTLFISIFIFIFCLVFAGTAMAQFSATTHENIENLKDSLTEDAADFAREQVDSATQVIGNEVSEVTQSIIKKIPRRALEILKIVSGEILNFVRGNINDDVKQWFGRRKAAVIEGLREEKEEFEGGVKDILSTLWKKTKNIFKKEEVIKKLEE